MLDACSWPHSRHTHALTCSHNTFNTNTFEQLVNIVPSLEAVNLDHVAQALGAYTNVSAQLEALGWWREYRHVCSVVRMHRKHPASGQEFRIQNAKKASTEAEKTLLKLASAVPSCGHIAPVAHQLLYALLSHAFLLANSSHSQHLAMRFRHVEVR